MKNFIFDYEPSAWNFDVEEQFKGQKQYVDITDDRTGEPHFTARENIAMYINEGEKFSSQRLPWHMLQSFPNR